MLREALEADPAAPALGIENASATEIRVLCPRGHFIANVAVINLGDRRLLLRPRGKDQQHFGDTFADPNHGFRFAENAGNKLRVRLQCLRDKCSYDGSFEHAGLAADLARQVANGHAEYRLTS